MFKRFLCGLIFTIVPVAAAAQTGAPPGDAAAQPLRLTLAQAIERGLANNLRVLAAGQRIEEAEGARERRFSALLPRARVDATTSIQNRSLRALGISFPGVPDVVPLYSIYDFRVSAEQPVFDRQSYHNWKASEQQGQAVRHDYQDLRDLLVRQIAGVYLNAQAAATRVEAAESRVATAETLLRLATERRAAGVATGVDVLRAEVQLANEQQRRIELRTAAQQALLVLARQMGMSPGTPIELADALRFEPAAVPEMTAALANSLASRADYLALASQREALLAQQRANRARYYPKVSVRGDYGGIGRAVGQVQGTGTLAAGISMTVFDRDRAGEEAELEARVKRLDHQMTDLRLGIEQEIRDAALVLESAAQEVGVAARGRELAARELELARERFAAGVATNLEIVSAQQSVARAQENYILAVSRHTDAKAALDRALGATQAAGGRGQEIR
jgi:outer membrane protein TolC